MKDLLLRKYNFDVFKNRSLIKINRYKRDKRLFYVFEKRIQSFVLNIT